MSFGAWKNVFEKHCALMLCPPQAETRAEFAERSVAKLEKTIDDLEGMFSTLLSFTTINTSWSSQELTSLTAFSVPHSLYLNPKWHPKPCLVHFV